MKNLGYYNGKIGLIEEMSIPMSDRVCVFGDGIYDATYSRNHIIYNLKEHVDRFFSSAAKLRMEPPFTKEELGQLLSELVRKVDDGEQFVYFQLTRGSAPRDHAFPDAKPNLWVMLTPRKIKDNRVPVKLITVEDTRFLHCDIKTLNLLPSVMAAQLAKEAGCDEVVFHRGDRVTEGSHSNISMIENGVFVTPPTDNLILPGIARANLIKASRALGIPVSETPFTLDRLMNADEVIVSSSGSFCLSATHIDGRPVGGKRGDLLEALRAYLENDFVEATNK